MNCHCFGWNLEINKTRTGLSYPEPRNKKHEDWLVIQSVPKNTEQCPRIGTRFEGSTQLRTVDFVLNSRPHYTVFTLGHSMASS